MDKLTMHSPDLASSNVDRIAELFPTVVTETWDAEGTVVRAVDFDLLRQELSDHVVEGPQERYQLQWPGKREALFAANAPIAKTLRPVREESVDFDTTKNLFIEGDNLDALKLLQESYLGKVKVIYIDPPYNTGGDRLVYSDNYAQDNEGYLAKSGQADDSGARLVSNVESSGRFHSDWLSMIYPRLKLARNLLSHDGVIFISIDDHEVANLRLVMDETFGPANFVENYVWESNFRPDNSSRIERENAQHILCYARKKSELKPLVGAQKATEGLPSLTKSSMKESTLTFRPEWVEFGLPDGTYSAGDRGSGYRLENAVVIKAGAAESDFSLTGRVIWSQGYLEEQAAQGTKIVIKGAGFVPYSKKPETSALAPTTLIPRDDAKDVLAGNAEIRSLFGASVFTHPKPTSLLRYLIKTVLADDGEAVILDFFAGSASTADAVIRLNATEGTRHQYILVQLPEPTEEGTAAHVAGFGDIAALGRERVRRACARTIADAGLGAHDLDVGFRALRVDSTNMAEVLRTPDETNQQVLAGLEQSVNADRSGEDLLFQVLVDWGLELTMPIRTEEIDDREVFVVEVDALIACFAETVSSEVVSRIAEQKPLRAVFRDSGFDSDAARINAEQLFREISPNTEVKAI